MTSLTTSLTTPAPPAAATPAPKISVCCAWYNRAAHLQETMDSLLAQDSDDFEIVVVNDGSPDPAVARILDGIRDPRLKVVHQPNAGLVAALRAAIAHARGDYIAIQGAGDLSAPTRLRTQAAILDAHPACAGVNCLRRETVTGGPHDGQSRVVDHMTGLVGEKDLRIMQTTRWNPFNHGSMMFRRSAYDAAGGYRDAFWLAQDMDLWVRMADHGLFYICPEILYDRRLFAADGIHLDAARIAQQMALSSFARHCHRQRRAFGFDAADIFGAHAGLFRRRTRPVAVAYAKTALKYLYAGNTGMARFYAEMAREEKWTPLTLAASALAAILDKSPRALALYRKGFARLLTVRDLKNYG